MYEFLKKYIGIDNGGNRFWRVTPLDINKAEAKLGFLLPFQLKQFYLEIGCGFLSQKENADTNDEWDNINGIIGPDEIVELYMGESFFFPTEGFVDGFFPFFDVGESSFFLLSKNENNLNVYMVDGKQILADNLFNFITELYKNPNFYNEL